MERLRRSHFLSEVSLLHLFRRPLPFFMALGALFVVVACQGSDARDLTGDGDGDGNYPPVGEGDGDGTGTGGYLVGDGDGDLGGAGAASVGDGDAMGGVGGLGGALLP